MDYLEKLKDPRWQKKRLEIFKRDGWKCKSCGSADKTLHVHHLFYFRGKEPWEINSGFLLTLCEDCHAPSQDEYWSSPEVIRDDVGLLLNAIWGAGFDSMDLATIAYTFAQINRPLDPAIDIEIKATPYVFNKEKE